MGKKQVMQIMPRSIILSATGEKRTVAVPSTAQETISRWRCPDFPAGVHFCKMMHLAPELIARYLPRVQSHLTPGKCEIVSLSMLIDARTKNAVDASYWLPKNTHDLPLALRTDGIYGNILLLLTIDGSTILPLSRHEFQSIVDDHDTNFPSPMSISAEEEIILWQKPLRPVF
jgi:hypothetical protein